MEENQLYLEAVTTWGEEAQLRMLQEECSELAASIGHFFRGRGAANMLREMADVEIMLAQARVIFEGGVIDLAKEQKLKRLAERLRVAKERAQKP